MGVHVREATKFARSPSSQRIGGFKEFKMSSRKKGCVGMPKTEELRGAVSNCSTASKHFRRAWGVGVGIKVLAGTVAALPWVQRPIRLASAGGSSV